MSRHHEERVHEDHHQHLPLQPRCGRPGHLAIRHAGGTLPHVEAVSLDTWRGIGLSFLWLRIRLLYNPLADIEHA